MSFLGSLFDPVGAVATGGNNNSFDSVFSPGDNLFGDQGLGWSPDFVDNFNNNVTQPIGNFADNVVDSNVDELGNLGRHFGKNPGQVFYSGADPFSTNLWNGITNQHNTPFLDQWGGETKQDFQNSANRGVNTEDNGYVSSLAHMIAAYYAGGAIGNMSSTGGAEAGGSLAEGGSAAGNGAGFTGANAGWEAAGEAGEAGAGGASGSEAANAAYDAAKYAGGAYGAAAAPAANGAAQGAANALDNNQNPWKGAFQGGLRSGLGSNLDYAGAAGIDDPNYKNVLNGGINGGVRAGMSDTSQTGYGALVGALGGLASDAGRGISNYMNSPSGSNSTPGQSGGTNWENIAAGLGNLYMARRNDAGIQSQINNLGSLYSPNSPYAQQMQQTLDRQDAASGRRSQYGTRAVQLQAALAEANSRNAPTLANLYAQQRQNRFGQLSGLFAMGRNSGAFNGVGNYMQGFGSGVNANPTGYSQQVPMTSNSQLGSYDPSQDVSATIPDQLYGG